MKVKTSIQENAFICKVFLSTSPQGKVSGLLCVAGVLLWVCLLCEASQDIMVYMLKSWLKQHCDSLLFVVLGVFFFMLYSFPYWQSRQWSGEYSNGHVIYNSPDETATAVFINHYIEARNFFIPESLNEATRQVIHPRSVNVITRVGITPTTFLVPVGFLGIFFLYGNLLRLIGVDFLIFLTPLIAVIGVVFFYGLVQFIFTKKIAFISALLLLMHPAYWYYASRGLLNNVLFVDLLVVGFYFLFLAYQQRIRRVSCSIFHVLAGLFFGGAVLVRPSEIFLLCGVLFLIGVFSWRRIRLPNIFLFLLSFAIGIMTLLWQNATVYGNPFMTGYGTTSELANVRADFTLVSVFSNFSSQRVSEFLRQFFLPFGFHPQLIIQVAVDYFFSYFGFFSFLAVIGALLLFIKNIQNRHERKIFSLYLLISLVVTTLLVTVYGSWSVTDNINGNEVSIASSYVRYFLPIFVVLTPLMGYAIVFLVSWIRGTASLRLLLWLFFGVSYVVASTKIVLLNRSESLVGAGESVHSYYAVEERVNRYVAPSAVLLVDRADKIFWPKRKVVVYLRNEDIFSGVEALVLKQVLVYYYLHTELAADIQKELNNTVLPKYGLKIEQLKRFDQGDYLYRIIKKP